VQEANRLSDVFMNYDQGVKYLVETDPVFAQQSTSKSMSFSNCLKVIRNTSQQLGIAPRNIVETNDLRMVKFVTSNGEVLVTCSRPDRKMVLTISK
jgi:hypothetical protein